MEPCIIAYNSRAPYRMNHVIDTVCRPVWGGSSRAGGVVPVHGRAVFVCRCLISCIVSFLYLRSHSAGPMSPVDRRPVCLSRPLINSSYCIQLCSAAWTWLYDPLFNRCCYLTVSASLIRAGSPRVLETRWMRPMYDGRLVHYSSYQLLISQCTA